MTRSRAPERKGAAAGLASIDGTGRFAGYASLFGRTDLSGDIVMPGAFSRTLKRRGARKVRMLLEHDPRAPIGTWDLVEEDARGLWVEGRLAPSSGPARSAAEAMGAGTLDGLSIGFRTVAATEDRVRRVRRINEIDLWEVSVVKSPMLPEARARAATADRAASWGLHPGQDGDAGLLSAMRRLTTTLREPR